MSCYATPRLVNIPMNRVQRFGETRNMGIDASHLNMRFLSGERLDRSTITTQHRGIAPHEELLPTFLPVQRTPRTIMRAHGASLGDLWATCNWLLRRSEAQQVPIYLSRWQDGAIDIKPLLDEILSLVESTGYVRVVDEPPTQCIDDRYAVWSLPYCPTRQRWTPGPYGRIAIQLDGRSYAKEKNPPDDERALLESPWMPGSTITKIGLPLTLEQSVEVLAHSDVFLGVCSGMSHVAHSVGTPCFLLEYGIELINSHRGNRYIKCRSATDAIEKVRGHLLSQQPQVTS